MKSVPTGDSDSVNQEVDIGELVLRKKIETGKSPFNFVPNHEEELVERDWTDDCKKAADLSSFETSR